MCSPHVLKIGHTVNLLPRTEWSTVWCENQHGQIAEHLPKQTWRSHRGW